jgi:tetratricopeptide (TPR) repeat protein
MAKAYLTVFLVVMAALWGEAQALAGSTTEKSLSLSEGICVRNAQALFSKGKATDAIETLEAFIQKRQASQPEKPVHPYLHFLLGNWYLTQSQDNDDGHSAYLTKAAQSYRAAVKTDPEFAQAWLNLARCAYEAGHFDEAAISFEAGYDLAQTPKPLYLYYASVCRFQAGHAQQALALFERLLKQHPTQVPLPWKAVLVNILFTLEKYKNALVFIEELAWHSAPEKQKKWQEILLSQYLNLGKDAKALSCAQKLTRMDPTEPRWWKGLSHIHLKNNDYSNGLTALIIYGFLTPMTQEELELTADLYMALDIPKKAAQLYQDVLGRDHDMAALEKLVQAFALAHDPDNAVKWIDKGLVQQPGQPDRDLLVLKAQLLYVKRSWHEAAQAYEKAAQHSSGMKNEADIWLMLGYSALNDQDPERARTAFEKASRTGADKKQAMRLMTQAELLKKHLAGQGDADN